MAVHLSFFWAGTGLQAPWYPCLRRHGQRQSLYRSAVSVVFKPALLHCFASYFSVGGEGSTGAPGLGPDNRAIHAVDRGFHTDISESTRVYPSGQGFFGTGGDADEDGCRGEANPWRNELMSQMSQMSQAATGAPVPMKLESKEDPAETVQF